MKGVKRTIQSWYAQLSRQSLCPVTYMPYMWTEEIETAIFIKGLAI